MRIHRQALLAAAAVVAVLLPGAAGLYGDFLWFMALDHAQVFTTILGTRALLFLAAGGVAAAVLLLNLRAVRRNGGGHVPYSGAAAVLVGAAIGLLYSGAWPTVLRFLHGQPFGTTDPVFGLDVAFYVFTLPFYDLLVGYAFLVTGAAAAMALGLYAFRFGDAEIHDAVDLMVAGETAASEFTLTAYLEDLRAHAAGHVAALAGTFLLVVAALLFLSRYDLLLSGGGTVHGLGHADALVRLPLRTALAGIAAAAGIAAFARLRFGTTKLAGGLVALLVVAGILGTVAAGAVQAYVVEPDEFNKERQFLEREIAHTREAYGLEDVMERDFPAAGTLDRAAIDRNRDTIDNVRLWDWRPLRTTFNELQIFRTYYTFTDVDIDRYDIGGADRQVMLSAREIDVDALPPQSRSWVNRHLVYTHGYGLTMSPVRNLTEEGLPHLYIKDIPPNSTVDVPVTEPRIYYGENTDSYAIVNTGTREFDYPAGDENAYTSYAGGGGIELSPLRQLVYAAMFGAPQILLSDSIEEDSRIQYRRTVQDRVKRIAPFLKLDGDPYLVVADGELKWVQDAYTTTDSYPYSRPVRMRGEQANYVRNSVKVVMDAHDGDPTFYVADEEPIIETWRDAFPGLFREMDEMPAAVRDHVRYPQDLFQVQAHTYQVYHMQDPQVFYNREDVWRVPNEVLRGEEAMMEPYYLMMKLPGEDGAEFMQILPFIPRGKQNLIGWMASRSDPPNYGELQAFQFPKQELAYGPMQVESRIDQDTDISQQITLWSQSGSDVFRGNLLAIPVEESILYVEPLFLESREEGSLPQLKRVIVAQGERLTMQPTLDAALEVLFGEREEEPVTGPLPDGRLEDARTLYGEAQAALRAGNFSLYSQKIEELGAVLEE